MEKATNWSASHFPSVFWVRGHWVSKSPPAVLRSYGAHCAHLEAWAFPLGAHVETWNHILSVVQSRGSLIRSLRDGPGDYSDLTPGHQAQNWRKEAKNDPISHHSFWYFQKTNPHQSSPPIKGWSWMKTRWRKSPLCSSLPLTRRRSLQNWSTESPESPSWATWNTQHHQVSSSSLTSPNQKLGFRKCWGQPHYVYTLTLNLPLLVFTFGITSSDHYILPCIILTTEYAQ